MNQAHFWSIFILIMAMRFYEAGHSTEGHVSFIVAVVLGAVGAALAFSNPAD